MTGCRIRGWATTVALGALVSALRQSESWMGGPPMRSWEQASRWYEAVGPAVAVVAAWRLMAMALAIWLLIATASQLLVLRGGRTSSARRLADLIAPRSLQRFVHGLAGLSLTAGLAVAAPGAGILGDRMQGVAVLRPVEDPPAGAATATMHALDDPAPPADPPVPSIVGGSATMRSVDDAPTSTPVPPSTTVPASTVAPDPRTVAAPTVVPMPPAPVPADRPAMDAADVVVVDPGDSFWSIARETLLESGAGEPSDAAITHYWQRLIEANRANLVEPANPDLIYAGQRLVLPSS